MNKINHPRKRPKIEVNQIFGNWVVLEEPFWASIKSKKKQWYATCKNITNNKISTRRTISILRNDKEYHKRYYIENKRTIQLRAKEKYHNLGGKEKAQQKALDPIQRVKRSAYMSDYRLKYYQKDYKCFLKNRLKGIKESFGKQYEFNLDINYLINLFDTQNGRCALSGLPMDHKFNSIYSISIDRIRSQEGHIKGNVQLTCKFFNLGKNNHSNSEVIELVEKLKSI